MPRATKESVVEDFQDKLEKVPSKLVSKLSIGPALVVRLYYRSA